MPRLEWTSPAADELEAAQTYYHDLNPRAARILAKRIIDAARLLREHPQVGRAGLMDGTREWVVSKTPYVLVYRQTADMIEILHVWNAARDWTRSEV